MHQGTYLDSTNNRPVRLGIVVALHAAALAAIILAPTEKITRDIFGSTEIYNVPDKKPPPPDLPPPTSKKQTETPSNPTPLVPSDVSTDTIKLTPLDEVKPTPVTAETTKSVPAPEPILIDAQPDPRAAGRFQPDYPTYLARAEITGRVTVKVLVGIDGRVKAVQQVSATEPGFYEATERQAFKYWRFKPATRDGVPVESWRTMTVRFQLDS